MFIKLWAGKGEGAIAGFNDIVYRNVIPAMFKSLFDPGFIPEHGISTSVSKKHKRKKPKRNKKQRKKEKKNGEADIQPYD